MRSTELTTAPYSGSSGRIAFVAEGDNASVHSLTWTAASVVSAEETPPYVTLATRWLAARRPCWNRIAASAALSMLSHWRSTVAWKLTSGPGCETL